MADRVKPERLAADYQGAMILGIWHNPCPGAEKETTPLEQDIASRRRGQTAVVMGG